MVLLRVFSCLLSVLLVWCLKVVKMLRVCRLFCVSRFFSLVRCLIRWLVFVMFFGFVRIGGLR